MPCMYFRSTVDIVSPGVIINIKVLRNPTVMIISRTSWFAIEKLKGLYI